MSWKYCNKFLSAGNQNVLPTFDTARNQNSRAMLTMGIQSFGVTASSGKHFSGLGVLLAVPLV
ncbi:MAG: hypothetical protein U5L96_07485 [Owenweeksia sp.]|nr:hypothetical protein [Owenweeksia sp.]